MDQAGKNLSYHSHRKPYSSEGKSIGVWKKNNECAATSTTALTYVLPQKQREKGELIFIINCCKN